MIYVMLMNRREGLTRDQRAESFARRARWQPPAGLKVQGEYWLSSDAPAVIVVFEADSYEPILEVGMTWGDLFSISTFAATTPDEGLRMGQAIMQRVAQPA
jgi:hypothetical protein